VKPAAFEYHAPGSVEEALELLTEHGWDAKPLAGGQSLIPAMNFRLARPAVLVDLNGIEELTFIRGADEGTDEAPGSSGSNDGVRIGAMTRQRAVERSPLIARRAPLLSETMPHVAHPQIRNRGTIGGSAVHADPASEIPAVLLAMNAKCRIRGPEGERTVAAEEFFLGLFGTVLAPDELLLEIELPGRRPRRGCAFREIARRHGDYAMAGIAASLTLDKKGAVDEARLAYLSVGGAPSLAAGAAEALVGAQPTEEVIREAARVAAAEDVEPMEDMHASARYRARLVEVLTRQALTTAAQRASGASNP
jgi:carbon-monoxide dehydrogenase medium subunit